MIIWRHCKAIGPESSHFLQSLHEICLQAVPCISVNVSMLYVCRSPHERTILDVNITAIWIESLYRLTFFGCISAMDPENVLWVWRCLRKLLKYILLLSKLLVFLCSRNVWSWCALDERALQILVRNECFSTLKNQVWITTISQFC